MTIDILTCSQEQTEEAGRRFASCLKPGDAVAMYGDLGAGKTAFVRGVLSGLGYERNVASPTFAIVNEYRGGKLDVAHFDVYRITGDDELYGTGFYDYLDGRNVLFIEWSENIPFAITDDMITVEIEHRGLCERNIRITSPEEIEF